MSEPPEEIAQRPGRGRKPLVLGLVLAVVAGGAGFLLTWTGMIPGLGARGDSAESASHSPDDGHGQAQAGGGAAPALQDIAFIAVNPVVISLGPGSSSRHLRFSAQLEVNAPYGAEVTMLMPRILDVLNGYLRAVSVREIEDPASLLRLRAQMLRRVQMVTGEGRVRDLLISEFVLN